MGFYGFCRSVIAFKLFHWRLIFLSFLNVVSNFRLKQSAGLEASDLTATPTAVPTSSKHNDKKYFAIALN